MADAGALIGWLDLGEKAKARASDYIASMKTPGTVDELGFGLLRDAFADLFFPATNTIMTRTRYVLFVPYLCLRVERDRCAGERAARRLRTLENELREALGKREKTGVIGKSAKDRLKRYPSNVYWRPLLPMGLGICTRQLWSQTDYFRHLAGFYEGTEAHTAQDGTTHVEEVCPGRNWHAGLEEIDPFPSSGRLPQELTFALTSAEARYLRARFHASEGTTASLLGHLLEHRLSSSFSYPWLAKYPTRLAKEVQHARYLSIFVKGATLQYYHQLLCAQQGDTSGRSESVMTEAFFRWWEAAAGELARWPLDEFFKLGVARRDRGRHTKEFLERWRRLCCDAVSARKALFNAKAQELIRTREATVKPIKGRFRHPDLLGPWKPRYKSDDPLFTHEDHIPYWLDYRSGIASTFVDDIVTGLRRRT